MAAAPAGMPHPKGALRAVTDAREERPSVSLIDADPDFAGVIPAADRALAEGVRLPLVELPAQSWNGPENPTAAGLLVLGGFVIRTLHRYGRESAELYGPGDLISSELPKDGTATWKGVHETSLVALDEHFEIAGRRWPALWRVTLERSCQRSERLAAHLAALQLSRVDERVEAVLWQLADRFGKVTTDGVVLPIRLTHQLLGFLTAAKRPTVSVALGELTSAGRVLRLADGGWLLRRPGFGQDEVGTERRGQPR